MNLLKRNLRLKINFKRNIMNTNVAIQYLMRESKSFTSEEEKIYVRIAEKKIMITVITAHLQRKPEFVPGVEWKPIS